MKSGIKKISIVIPVYNEEENIQNLYQELKAVLDNLNKNYEIIFVDDGSKDHSLPILKKIFTNDQNIEIISLLGNHGQTSALATGFAQTRGDIIIAMDGDGQHNPRYIPDFIAAIEQGFDVASGWKEKNEGAGIIQFFLSNLAHKIIAKISGAKMKYFGATMKAYRKNVLKNLDLAGDLHRFAGALIYYKGIKIKEIPIKIRARKKGKSSYNLGKTSKVALDLILIRFLVKYSKTPFRIFGLIGVLLILLGIIGIGGVFVAKYGYRQSTASNASVLIISAILSIVGVQFIFFGLMAELISRVYYTSGNKKFYNIKEHWKHRSMNYESEIRNQES